MELTRLRKLGALEPGTCSKWVSRIFMVPKPGGVSWRLIIDLRRINLWCKLFSMKLETLKKLRTLARRTDYMFSMDLADGFYSLGIEESARDYFTVCVNGQLWRLASLPMGWCLSPYYFCELMKVWVRAMRAPSVVAPPGRRSRKRGKMRPPSSARGARLLPYVDDFLFLAHSLAAALLLRARVESLLTRLGLKRNPRKGEWEPTQALTHLGMIVDLKQGLFIAPSEKLQAVATLAKGLLGRAARNRHWRGWQAKLSFSTSPSRWRASTYGSCTRCWGRARTGTGKSRCPTSCSGICAGGQQCRQSAMATTSSQP